MPAFIPTVEFLYHRQDLLFCVPAQVDVLRVYSARSLEYFHLLSERPENLSHRAVVVISTTNLLL